MITQPELVRLFAEAMEARGHVVASDGDRLEHRESGITIRPLALEPVPAPPLVRSVVVVTANHSRFPPAGLFEYQHSVAGTEIEAIRNGIDQWLQIDFTVLVDSLRDRPEHCPVMQWEWPDEGASEFLRRVLLGPIGHLVEHPERAQKNVEHPFCACCLFTNTYEAFHRLMRTEDFYAVRLLAIRDENGTQADCRVNGHEWEAGKRALRAYAETWPQAGYEMRKQYIVMQSVDRASI